MGRHSLPRARHAGASRPLSRFLPYATIAVALTGATIALTHPTATQAPAASAATITEDSPGWDCTTMGNRQCGAHASRYVMSDGTPGGYWEDDHGAVLDCDDTPCQWAYGTGQRTGLLVVEYAPDAAS